MKLVIQDKEKCPLCKKDIYLGIESFFCLRDVFGSEFFHADCYRHAVNSIKQYKEEGLAPYEG